MSGNKQSVVEATAAVFVQGCAIDDDADDHEGNDHVGRRVGSAVLVDVRHLITARHVLLCRDSERGVRVLVDQVEVEFPASTVGRSPQMTASRLDLGPQAENLDLAALELTEPVPEGLGPVLVWPAERLPERVAVFGYPLAEGSLVGVWREFKVVGPTTAGAIQLNWFDDGSFKGQSGGPVVDMATAAVVGILVQGSRKGRFDRFVPVSEIWRVWPGMPRPWLFAGLEAKSHYDRRARGQRSRSRGGDLFRSRQAALSEVRDWLTAEDPPGLPLVVTGQPGAGKSSVLARAVLGLQADGVRGGLAFHGRDATHADLLSAVASLTGVEGAGSRDELVDALAKTSPVEPRRVAVDALDEAATAADRQQLTETLTELAALPSFRVAVATRPLAVSDRERYLSGGLLFSLSVTASTSANLVDLDTDRYFDEGGLEEFVAALLAQIGVDRPGPPGRSWMQYRADPDLRRRLARVIADRADRNYLVAAMAAVPLSEAAARLDPWADGFDERLIPSGVGEALSKYLDRLPEPERARTRALLTALGYARGVGIDDRLWLRFAAALGYPADIVDLDRLRSSMAADYLLQTATAESGPVTRLFHQALTDQLLDRHDQRNDERQLLEALLERKALVGGWAAAGDYVRRHAADHAAAAGELAGLLEDPHYLAVADLARLMPLLVEASSQLAGNPTAMIVRQVGIRAAALPPARRARLLALTAAHLGFPDIQRRLATACSDGIVPLWAHSLGVPHQELTGHVGRVRAVALGSVGAREVVVSASDDHTVRIWDARTGQPVGVRVPRFIGGSIRGFQL